MTEQPPLPRLVEQTKALLWLHMYVLLIAFVVGYAAIAWFLKFLVNHGMYWFVGYRVILGTVVLILLGTGVVAAT